MFLFRLKLKVKLGKPGTPCVPAGWLTWKKADLIGYGKQVSNTRCQRSQ